MILVLGCLGGLALGLFSQHVASMSDSLLGPTPLSWGFKSNSARVAAAFETSKDMRELKQSTITRPPSIDLAIPQETESALFALG